MNNIIKQPYILNDYITNGFNIITLDIITITAILCGVFVIVSKNPIVSVLFLIGLFLNISVYLMMLGINFIGLSYLLVYVGAVSILFLFILMLINVRISEIVSTTSNSIPLGIFIGTLFFSAIYKALPKSEMYITPLLKTYQNNDKSNTILLSQPELLKNIEQIYIMQDNDSLGLSIIYNSIKNEIYKYFYGIYNLFSAEQNKNGINNNYMINNSESTDNTISFIHLTYSHNWDSMLNEVSHINTLGNILYTSYPLWILLTSIILLLAMVGAIIITLKN